MTNDNKTLDDELTKPLVQDYVQDDVEEQPLKPIRATRKRGMPCWCKCVLVTFAALFTMGAMVTCVVYHAVADTVRHFTVSTPHEKFPVVEMTDRQLDVVKDRVELFVDRLLAGETPPAPLEITQDEINGFVGRSDFLRGNVFVTVNEGSIHEDYSLPTSLLPGGAGRYFVANDYLNVEGDAIEMKLETAATHHDWFDGPIFFAQLRYLVSDETDLLELYLAKGSFFGQVAPRDWIDQRQNLLDGLFNDPGAKDARAVVEGIERVTIHEGKIVVEPKA